MVMTNQEKIELLTKARDLIIENGLSHKCFIRSNGCMCTVGAIIKANNPILDLGNNLSLYTSQQNVMEIIEVMYSIMHSVIKHKEYHDEATQHKREVIYEVNDMSTQDEVVDYFNKAIESLS